MLVRATNKLSAIYHVGEARNKILIITDISVLGFYGYIGNIYGYFDKNIGKAKINKNTLLNYKKDINKQIYTC